MKYSHTHISSLDSLRGIFALMIVVLHTPVAFSLLNAPIVRNSHIFVDYFFVLSGFVVTLSYGKNIADIGSLRNFLIKRFFRLWPLHFLMILFFILLLFLKIFINKLGYASADVLSFDRSFFVYVFGELTFLNAFRNEAWLQMNFPSWSINAEFWAYVTFGLTSILFGLRWIVSISVIIISGSILIGAVEVPFGQAFNGSLFRALIGFFLGGLAYISWKSLNTVKVFGGSLQELFIFTIVLFSVIFYSYLPAPEIITPVIFSISIFILAFQKGVVSRLLSRRAFLILGERSYSIYMIHIFILSCLGSVQRAVSQVFGVTLYVSETVGENEIDVLKFGPSWVMDIYMIVFLALVVWLSGLTYRWVERPGMALGRKVIHATASDRLEP